MTLLYIAYGMAKREWKQREKVYCNQRLVVVGYKPSFAYTTSSMLHQQREKYTTINSASRAVQKLSVTAFICPHIISNNVNRGSKIKAEQYTSSAITRWKVTYLES